MVLRVEAQEMITNIRDKTTNLSPPGFKGLGISAILLSLSYIGLYPADSMIGTWKYSLAALLRSLLA